MIHSFNDLDVKTMEVLIVSYKSDSIYATTDIRVPENFADMERFICLLVACS